MGNPAQVKRKHSRFPAYDDETGVKLSSGSSRRLFKDEPLMLHQADAFVDTFTEMEGPVSSGISKTADDASGKQVLSQEQQEELKRHKLNLPDYSTNRNKITERHKKVNLFGNLHKKSKENYEAAAFNKTTSGRKVTAFGDGQKSERSYFVPTYTPASVIPDKTTESEDISEQELLAAMAKTAGSYLIMDTEDTFKEKKSSDPSVQKFNVPKESPEIPVTRRQYQKIRPNMKRFGQDDPNNELPRSRSELKSAKNQAKVQTAYGQKVSEAKAAAQKKGILDKSLSGIIEDSQDELDSTKLFT